MRITTHKIGDTFSRVRLYNLGAGTWTATAPVYGPGGSLLLNLACTLTALGAPDVDGNTHSLVVLATAAQTATWSETTLVSEVIFRDASPVQVVRSAEAYGIKTLHYADGTDSDDPAALIPGSLLPALRGEPGISAYDVAVENGFVGSEAAWLASLVGPQGPVADIAAIVNAATSKTTPVDADAFAGIDSAASFGLKKFTWANIKATLKTYFDTAYLKLTGGVLAGGIRTASGSTLTVSETWNNASVAFPGALVVEVTNTASAAGSLLADFKVGGTSKFHVDKNGNVRFGRGDYESASVISNGSKYSSLELGTDGGVQLSLSKYKVASNGVPFSAGWGGFFEIDADNGGTNVVRVYRDAANILAQRNGANAQTFRVYGSYTEPGNGRWLEQSMTTAGVAVIKPTGIGTGASGNVLHISGLPTSNPGPGILWNNGGSVAIGT